MLLPWFFLLTFHFCFSLISLKTPQKHPPIYTLLVHSIILLLYLPPFKYHVISLVPLYPPCIPPSFPLPVPHGKCPHGSPASHSLIGAGAAG